MKISYLKNFVLVSTVHNHNFSVCGYQESGRSKDELVECECELLLLTLVHVEEENWRSR